MTQRYSLRYFTSIAITLMLLIGLWWFVLPPQLGGRTTFFTTAGVSMQPTLRSGDLAILRTHSSYRVNDVIAFRSPSLNATLLHRIISIDEDGITTKGDNNSWTDVDHPTKRTIIGRMDAHYAGGGKYVHFIQSIPVRIALAALAGLAIYYFFRGDKTVAMNTGLRNIARRKRRRSAGVLDGQEYAPANEADSENNEIPDSGTSWSLRALMYGIVGLLMFCLATPMAFLSYTSPTRGKAGEVMYNHRGRFEYSGAVNNNGDVVYGSDKAQTGDPIFLHLIKELYATYTYEFDSGARFRGGGTIDLSLVVEGKSGWHRSFPLGETVTFTGSKGSAAASVNLEDIASLRKKIQQLISVADNNYTVSIQSNVSLKGNVGGKELNESFPSRLAFNGDANALRVSADTAPPGTRNKTVGTTPGTAPEAASQGLNTGRGGTVFLPIGEELQMKLAGHEFRVVDVRVFATLLLLISLVLLAAAKRSIKWGTFAPASNHFVNDASAYNELFVGVTTASVNDIVIDVATLQEMITLAIDNDQLILHEQNGSSHLFVLNLGRISYRHTTKARRDLGNGATNATKSDSTHSEADK